MDLEAIMYAGQLDDSFPLPPAAPFTRRQALAAGIPRRVLEELVDAGLLRRPLKGVYLATQAGDSVRLRAECLHLVAPPDCVVVDRHAGWLHGAQMILAPGEHLNLRPLSLFRPSGHGRLRNGLSTSGERNLDDDEITEVHGIPVSTPIRTAWDLGRVRWPDQAIAGLDAMLRLGAFDKEELLAGIDRFRGMRWVTTLRTIAPLADGRAESPGESVLRLRCVEVGVHLVPQVEVYRNGILIARLDLADEAIWLAIEYDGEEWHSSPDQLRHDRDRRADLEADGWIAKGLGKQEVFGRERACEAIIREAAREARIRRGLRLA